MSVHRTLVVDDSRTIRMVLRRYLVESGFEVFEAADGVQALQQIDAQHDQIQLVLADWNMPEMNGLRLVQELRSRPALGHTKIIMVTTEAELGHLTSALEAGADEYIMKPFTKEMLLQKLELLGMLPAAMEQTVA